MAVVTMRQLLESGVHFGHQTRRWNPKMKRFIFTERNGIYIIDLQQSLAYIDAGYEYVKNTVARGGTILFVGTKRQAQEPIEEQAKRVGMPYVNQRWLGGMLTNFQTMHQRLQRMKELEEIDFDDVSGSGRTKKELLQMRREYDKLSRTLGGVRDMSRSPGGRLDRRHQEGAPGGRRGQEAGHPDRRDPRHQLRPRRRRLPDPGQRRRHPFGQPPDARRRRRRRRGPARPRRQQDRRGGGRLPSSAPTSRWPSGSASCSSRRTPRPRPTLPRHRRRGSGRRARGRTGRREAGRSAKKAARGSGQGRRRGACRGGSGCREG